MKHHILSAAVAMLLATPAFADEWNTIDCAIQADASIIPLWQGEVSRSVMINPAVTGFARLPASSRPVLALLALLEGRAVCHAGPIALVCEKPAASSCPGRNG